MPTFYLDVPMQFPIPDTDEVSDQTADMDAFARQYQCRSYAAGYFYAVQMTFKIEADDEQQAHRKLVEIINAHNRKVGEWYAADFLKDDFLIKGVRSQPSDEDEIYFAQ